MKSQFTGFILLSVIFVFVFSFGNSAVIKKTSASVTFPNPAENEDEFFASVLGTVYYVRTDGDNENCELQLL